MKSRIVVLILAALVFIGAVFAIRKIAAPALSSIKQVDVQKFELLTDDTESTPIPKEVLLSSPLIILDKGTATPFTPSQVIIETNRNRSLANLPALKENAALAAAAEAKVRDMFEHQYFDHISPLTGAGPDSLAKNARYQYVSIGENLALGNFGDEASLLDAWMKSPGHRANILRSQFQEIGVAVGRGQYKGQEVLIAVQEFGRPISSCPSVDSSLKVSITSDKAKLSTMSASLNVLKTKIDQFVASSTASQNEYEASVSAYNTQIGTYNDLVATIREHTALYNTQVRAFNSCLQNSI